jgi:pimeloyl-ACP methyl ester carboxylesterase
MFLSNKILHQALITLFLVLTTHQQILAQSAAKGVKNVVLVHGAFADGSSWAKLIPLLQAKGYNVTAVQNPLTSLEDDVAATKRAIALMNGPVLLVGHSWGGTVITEAGNDPKVAGLVYVAASVPKDGQSLLDVVQGYPVAPGSAEFREDAWGFQSLTLKGIDEDFAQDVSPKERAVIFATQVPWAKKSVSQKITKAAWKTKPSWFIVAANDRMIDPDLERAEAKMIKATTLELQSSHVPMVSQPGRVAAFIIDAARSVPAQPDTMVTEDK